MTETVSRQGTAGACPVCQQPWGDSVACQFCGQIGGRPAGERLATIGRRFGGYLLDFVLILVTLLIGWLVWSLIIWRNGQTPAKQLLGMYCVSLGSRERAGWGTMFMREFVAKVVIMNLLGLVTLGIAPLILNFRLIWNKNRQEVWDSVAETVVARAVPG